MAKGGGKKSAKALRDAANKLLADNRFARHQYEILETLARRGGIGACPTRGRLGAWHGNRHFDQALCLQLLQQSRRLAHASCQLDQLVDRLLAVNKDEQHA